jgi:hypothetical protein
LSGAFQDFLQRCLVVEIEPVDRAEPVPERRTEECITGGGTDEGEAGQVEAEALGPGAFTDNDIQSIVFQSRI